jgi:hypothetical protein
MSRASRGSAAVGCVAWLALLVALAALLLSWMAFRRSGGRLDELLHGRGAGAAQEGAMGLAAARDALGRGEREVEWHAALAQAEARLAGRRAEIETRRDVEAARREVDGVRRDLARAVDDAGAAARTRWQALDDDLGRLDRELREGSSRALATLDGLLGRIRGALGGGGAGSGAGGSGAGGSGAGGNRGGGDGGGRR